MNATMEVASLPQTFKQVIQQNEGADHPWGVFEAQELRRLASEEWTRLLDSRLITWGRVPANLEDDGVSAPSGDTIEFAYLLGIKLRDANFRPPNRLVPAPDGGIVFEFDFGPTTIITLEILGAAQVEMCVFVNGKIVQRNAFGGTIA